MSRAQGVAARQHAIIVILFTAVLATALTTGGCGDQMVRMEQNQVRLQAMIMANARQLSTVSAQVDRGQNLTDEAFAKVDQDTQAINTQVQTVQREQAQLHAALLDGNHEINREIAQLDRNQTHLKEGVAQVGNIAQKTNAAVGAVARDQATLHRMVQDNKQELADSITTVANNQNTTHAGITQLHQADRSLAGKQDTLQRLAQNNNRQVVDRLTAMDTGQQQLGADIGNLHSLAQTVATDVTTLGTQQAALHDTVNNNTTTLADKLVLLEQHQLDFQSIIDRVANTTSHTANDVTALTTGQAEMQQTQGAHYTALNGTLSTITDNQQNLQAGMGVLDQKADQTTAHLTDLATGQQTMQETMHANNASVVDGLTSLANNQRTLGDGVAAIDRSAEAIAADLGTVITNQSAVQNELAEGKQRFAAFSETHAAQAAALAAGQNNLNTGINQVSEAATQLAADQASMHETLQSQNEAAQGQMAKLAGQQHSVQDRVDTLMATASQLALNTVTMSNRQADFEQEVRTELTNLSLGTDQLVTGQGTLTQTLQDNNESLSSQVTGLATDQKVLQSDVETLTANTRQLGLHLVGLSDGQAGLQRTVEAGVNDLNQNTTQLATDLQEVSERQATMGQTLTAHNDGVSTRMARLSEGQQNLESNLNTLTATTTQVALDIITLDSNQAKIENAVQANGQSITSELTEIAQHQGQMQSGLDMLTTTTTQTALDVITLDGNQADIHKTLQANGQETAVGLSQVTERQGQMQSGLDMLTATTTQTALDVITLDGNQADIHKTLQANGQEVAAGLSQVTERQGQMQSGLDTLTATTTQVALDVITLDDNQAQQEKAIQANQQELASTLTAVVQDQEQLKSSLDTVTTTTNQVALDVITLDGNHVKLQQAVQANRQELVTKLAEIAQGQQQWLARFDAAQAQVETMTAGITALEQRVTRLQGTLQTSLDDLSTLLDAESQQQVQFEQSVRQDMQGVADTISQLREVQAGLAEHIQRIQDSSQNQAGDILSALEQLQQNTNAEAPTVEAEMKSSKASPREIMLP